MESCIDEFKTLLEEVIQNKKKIISNLEEIRKHLSVNVDVSKTVDSSKSSLGTLLHLSFTLAATGTSTCVGTGINDGMICKCKQEEIVKMIGKESTVAEKLKKIVKSLQLIAKDYAERNKLQEEVAWSQIIPKLHHYSVKFDTMDEEKVSVVSDMCTKLTVENIALAKRHGIRFNKNVQENSVMSHDDPNPPKFELKTISATEKFTNFTQFSSGFNNIDLVAYSVFLVDGRYMDVLNIVNSWIAKNPSDEEVAKYITYCTEVVAELEIFLRVFYEL